MGISKEDFEKLKSYTSGSTRRRKGMSIWMAKYFRPHIWRESETLEIIYPGAVIIREKKRKELESKGVLRL